MRALLLSLLLALPGCGTVFTIAASGDGPRRSLVYSGTRGDAWALTSGFRFFEGLRVFAALDLPLSLALDTALLPLTLVQTAVVWSAAHSPSPLPEPERPPPPPKPTGDVVEVGGRPWREPRRRPFDAAREHRPDLR